MIRTRFALLLCTLVAGGLVASPGYGQAQERTEGPVRQEGEVTVGDRVRIVAPLPDDVGRPIHEYRLLAPPEEGTGERVEYRLRRVVGDLLAITTRTLTIDPEGRQDSVEVNLRTMVSLEVSRGRSAKTLEGAGIGLMAGALVGGVIGGSNASKNEDESTMEGAGKGAAILAGPGIVIGLLLGSQVKKDQWELVAMTAEFEQRSSGPSGMRLQLGVAYRF